MSGMSPAPQTGDNVMPNVIGKSLAAAKADINAHADHTVTYSTNGDSGTVTSTDPIAGKPIPNQVTIVVYTPPA